MNVPCVLQVTTAKSKTDRQSLALPETLHLQVQNPLRDAEIVPLVCHVVLWIISLESVLKAGSVNHLIIFAASVELGISVLTR